MASEAFLRAAKAANKRPVILLAVESLTALNAVCSTQTDWQAAKSAVGVCISDPDRLGSVVLATDDPDHPASGTYSSSTFAVNLSAQVGETTALSTSSNSRAVGFDIVVTTQGGAHGTLVVHGRLNGGNWQVIYTGEDFHAESATINIRGLAKGQWDTYLELVGIGGPEGIFTYQSRVDIYEVEYIADGSLRTPTLDLGMTPNVPSRLVIDQIVPTAGCAIAYSARGSDDGATWADLGVVEDGALLQSYRYYDVRAAFTSDGKATGELKEIRIIGGDSQFEYFSTHRHEPVRGAKPYIVEKGVNSLTSRIDLLKPTTTGEISLRLHWRKKTGDIISTGYLKNKVCTVKLGFVGLAESDYETFFTGFFHDHEDDHENRVVTIKLRDLWKKLQTKIPPEQPGTTNTADIVYRTGGGPTATPVNLVAEMLNLLSIGGVADRNIDRAAFMALRNGALSGSVWDVTRTLTSSTGLADLLNELAVSAGIFLVPLSDGRLTPILYDEAIAQEPVATLDARKTGNFSSLSGGQAELTTQTHIYYQLLPGKDGGSKEDFARALFYVNAQAEVDWQETQTREWLDKWGLSAEALQRMAQRWDGWFANPRYRCKVSKVPYRFQHILPGSIIAVNNLPMPCPAADWEGYTVSKKFLVLSRTDDPGTLTLGFDLFEVDAETVFIPNPDVPEYSRLSEFPLVTNLVLNHRYQVKEGGGVDVFLDVSFDTPADFHFGSAEIWTKTSGDWVLSGVLTNGGPSQHRTYALPAVSSTAYTIAVVTINAAGRRGDIESAPQLSLTTPEPPPPFFPLGTVPTVEVIDNNVLLRYPAAVGTFPVASYELRRGTDFDTAEVVGSSLGTFAVIFERTGGTYKYWVAARDTMGRLGEPISVYATVAQPPDFVLHDQRDLAEGWLGTKTNCRVQVDGALAALVNLTQTIQQHFDSRSWGSFADQVNAGYPVFAQPGMASASYEEVVDYGAVIASSRVTVDVTREVSSGSATVTPTISISANGTSWTDFPGQYQIYAVNFRYVKYRLDIASADGAVMRLSSVSTRLDVKQKTYEGTVSCSASDSGGTVVNISGKFIDVASIQVTPMGTTPVIPMYDFADVANPTQFKVLLFSTAGARVSGTASFLIRGV